MRSERGEMLMLMEEFVAEESVRRSTNRFLSPPQHFPKRHEQSKYRALICPATRRCSFQNPGVIGFPSTTVGGEFRCRGCVPNATPGLAGEKKSMNG